MFRSLSPWPRRRRNQSEKRLRNRNYVMLAPTGFRVRIPLSLRSYRSAGVLVCFL